MTDQNTIRHYMTPTPHTVGADQPLSTASEIMRKHQIRHLPVLRGGKLAGLLSQRDVLLIAGLPGVEPSDVPVEDAMADEVYTVAPDAPIAEVAAHMAAHKYGSALVVDGRDRVIGVFTTVDALRALTDAGAIGGAARP